ncbi:MAG: molecular chaperone DjlA [Coxiella sp. RIFCSPHIGHO2_12_FULL_42_15]|nr:MAG: molecular chaperone DjlA [Coxiella sp. RIFCSPHIGHO2_12_FULL_42_15]
MKWTGKIVGALIGLMFGHPFTVVMGLFIGHLYDIGLFSKWFGLPQAGHHHARVQEVFFNNTFTIMGHLAKCDGRVSESEIRIAQNVMDEMNLSLHMKREAIRLFNEGKVIGFNLDAALHELRSACWNRPSLLRIFIEIQMKIAFADGQVISPAKQKTLQYICQQLGIGAFNFSQFEQRYRAEQNYQHYRAHHQVPNPQAHLSDAYKVLGLSALATDAEIKKAYRRLMSQNHPDKLMAKGLPPEMIKMATQKTQQIKKAYEQICAARGVK